jgi:hypothetical protein
VAAISRLLEDFHPMYSQGLLWLSAGAWSLAFLILLSRLSQR